MYIDWKFCFGDRSPIRGSGCGYLDKHLHFCLYTINIKRFGFLTSNSKKFTWTLNLIRVKKRLMQKGQDDNRNPQHRLLHFWLHICTRVFGLIFIYHGKLIIRGRFYAPFPLCGYYTCYVCIPVRCGALNGRDPFRPFPYTPRRVMFLFLLYQLDWELSRKYARWLVPRRHLNVLNFCTPLII